jgi:hypothetical protein
MPYRWLHQCRRNHISLWKDKSLTEKESRFRKNNISAIFVSIIIRLHCYLVSIGLARISTKTSIKNVHFATKCWTKRISKGINSGASKKRIE